ncbi:tripartite tricarboxylate transporter substrate binding protein [Variovorax sp. Sphag1AA]|uniref:Bug family tripartite tricarboxylate transporter substrate binding protein n=1 Tax=Variovorax sp. Sphag1AA TaxID=2587027 RepID=UPI0018290DB6|nr:tripartite tricarboxylate transporter substrate binding protein [Variovorax sp. Sphag1AA]MBB3181611.1 tripartite-type tricarboxylate transporter receptor subunit TctC [Variovorax sp. Sphag1AA]
MNDTSKLSRRALLGAALAAPLAAWAQTRTFPTRPVRFIVPFAPGSNTDTLARLYGKAFSEKSGQPVVIENKSGGNGIPAVQAALAAPADGYTVFFSSNSTLTTNAAIFRKLPYDPLADFAPVTLVGGQYLAVIVPANSPHKTLADLLADARKRPGALNHAAGSPSYALWSAWLNEIAHIKTTNIMYKGAGDVFTAVAGGQVDYAIVDASASSEQVKGGRMRALAYTGEERYAPLPGVPTMAEASVPGFNPMAWSGVAVAAKTPPAVQQELRHCFAPQRIRTK